ncbi:MAG: protein-methionine-sulfoxide reductase catalytic subunit MsrP [Acetobacteraceae bacterium]
MTVVKRYGWEIPESQVTPEAWVLRRRAMLGAAVGFAAGGTFASRSAHAAATAPALPPMNPARNMTYVAGRALTDEKIATTYNNYYEFSQDKDLWRAAQKLTVSPWSVRIEGLVAKPRTIALADLLHQVRLQERVYRHRCVEAWSMTVPWTGFPMADLVKLAEPLGSAKYVVFTTVEEPKAMPGLDSPLFPWPYVEGVTMAEAMNELAFVSTGIYGKPLPKQSGAPIRITLPWKYGFKSGKAFVKVAFTATRPKTFWAEIAPDEYGFWANVNPAVPHPRWSQATERVIGTNQRVPTQIYNGYGPFVASLYAGMKGDMLYR